MSVGAALRFIGLGVTPLAIASVLAYRLMRAGARQPVGSRAVGVCEPRDVLVDE